MALNKMRIRNQFLLLVFASAMITAMYITYEANPGYFSLVRRNVVLVDVDAEAEEDVCPAWARAFPSHVIIIVSTEIPKIRSIQCYYMEKESTTIDVYLFVLKFQPAHVILANGNSHPMGCALRKVNNLPTILYSRHDDHIFDINSHWGYGGVAHNDSNTTFYFSRELESPVLTILSPEFVPSGCREVNPAMILGGGAHVRTENACLVLKGVVYWALPLLGYGNTATEKTALGILGQNLIRKSGYFMEHDVRFVGKKVRDIPKSVINDENLALDFVKHTFCVEYTKLRDCIVLFLEKFQRATLMTDEKLQMMKTWLSLTTVVENDYLNMYPAGTTGVSIKSFHGASTDKDRSASYVQKVHNPSTCCFDINKDARKYVETYICTNDTASLQRPWMQWTNMLVIVTYTSDNYGSLPLYETMYRPFFPHIVHCGPSHPNMSTVNLIKNFTFTFIAYGQTPAPLTNGSLNYKCLLEANKLGYKVDGYMQVADDVMLLPHRLLLYDTEKVWTWRLDNMVRVSYENDTFCDDAGCHVEKDKFWLSHKNRTLNALNALRTSNSTFAGMCANNIEFLYGGPLWSLRIISDMTYIPSHFMPQVTELLEIFLEHDVYVEIAMPTVLHCIIPPTEIQPIYTHFHNMASQNVNATYSAFIFVPDKPDLVVNSHQQYVNKEFSWVHATGQYFNGITFYHPYDMSRAALRQDLYAKFFCRLLRFHMDPTGNLTRAMASDVVVGKPGPPKPPVVAVPEVPKPPAQPQPPA